MFFGPPVHCLGQTSTLLSSYQDDVRVDRVFRLPFCAARRISHWAQAERREAVSSLSETR